MKLSVFIPQVLWSSRSTACIHTLNGVELHFHVTDKRWVQESLADVNVLPCKCSVAKFNRLCVFEQGVAPGVTKVSAVLSVKTHLI